MNADEMREIASMLHEILDNSATLDECKHHISLMADAMVEDADNLENEDD